MVDLDEKQIRTQVSALNRHRLTWVLFIFIFVHLAHVIAFWPFVPGAQATTERWHNEVILVHGALFAFLLLLLPVKLLLERHERRAPALLQAIPVVVSTVYLLGGTALAIVDQRVTAAITPLMAATLGVPLVIIVRPLVALCQYILILGLFLVGAAWLQQSPELLLTIRANAITAVGLGFGLALLQWRNQIQFLRQQHRINEQQRELEAKNRELMVLATRDSLTGLMNRAQFSYEVDQAITAMQGNRQSACLVMVDVDHFKAINDTHGHPVGDRILIDVAGLLTGTLRSTDVVGRFGGEEFAILMPGIPVHEGVAIAERLRAAISAHRFTESVQITASFGVAELQVGYKDGLAHSYRAADLALYQAKKDGRNCVRSFDPGAALRQVAVSTLPPEAD